MYKDRHRHNDHHHTDEQHNLTLWLQSSIPPLRGLQKMLSPANIHQSKPKIFCTGCWVIFAPGYQHILLVLLGKGVTEVIRPSIIYSSMVYYRNILDAIPSMPLFALQRTFKLLGYCQIIIMIFNQDFLSVTNYASCKQKRIVKCLQSNNALY